MSQAAIRAKFLTAISAYAAAHNPPLTIARENVAFTKPADLKTFLEVWILPANTLTPEISADRRRFMGNCQVSIWTKEGVGAGVAEAIAEDLYQLFPVVPKNYLPLSIEAPPSSKPALTDGTGWFVLPVVIPYRYEASN